MPLPSPNLDTRSFQEIVDDIKKQIALRCPEWTDHNVSDPGVTLIELFAQMTEMMLFRLNQVPEKNYVKFLEMIGVSLEMPHPATTDLRLMLTQAIEDKEGWETRERTFVARELVAATERTESEEAIEYSSDIDLRLVRPRLRHVLAVAAPERPPLDDRIEGDFEVFDLEKPPLEAEKAFRIFATEPVAGDALYLGFEGEILGNVIGLDTACNRRAAVGLNPERPNQVWEGWAGGQWVRLAIVDDGTKGFSEPGMVQVEIPHEISAREVCQRSGYWIRARYTLDPLELAAEKALEAAEDEATFEVIPYSSSPEIMSIEAKTVGGIVPASNCSIARNERLGRSTGDPGQRFKLVHAPMLLMNAEETLLIGPMGEDPNDFTEWIEWTRVDDFSESGPNDRHYICDPVAGEILFGPLIEQPDGRPPKQYGAVPPNRHNIVVRSYRFGGGAHGNVRDGQVRFLQSAVPAIAEVTNPRPAIGGRDRESLDRAKMRALEILKVRNRAVTVEDYEYLAAKATPAVGRACCLQPLTHPAGPDDPPVSPGTVRVLLVPAISKTRITPKPRDLRVPERVKEDVHHYLRERSLITTNLEIGEPEYIYASVHVIIAADPRYDSDLVARRVQEALTSFIHPVFGGGQGRGWAFGRALALADIYAKVGEVKGVAFLTDARIYTSNVVNVEEGLLSPEVVVTTPEGVRLLPGQVLCSRQHNVRVVSIADVGTEAANTRF